jgi:nucleotidyltransferase substrate binding protein (TIGR01987 family)
LASATLVLLGKELFAVLELEGLSKSINALSESIKTSEKHQTSDDKSLQRTLCAGVVQSFKVAYEQCWKMIQRWLKNNYSKEDTQFPRTRKELFRFAAKMQIIEDPLPWFTYGDARNLTSHTYDEEIAVKVYETALIFVVDAQKLLIQLTNNND